MKASSSKAPRPTNNWNVRFSFQGPSGSTFRRRGQDIRRPALECQPKICFFFGSIGRITRWRAAQIFSPACPVFGSLEEHAAFIRTTSPRRGPVRTRVQTLPGIHPVVAQWQPRSFAICDRAPLSQGRGEGPIISFESPMRGAPGRDTNPPQHAPPAPQRVSIHALSTGFPLSRAGKQRRGRPFGCVRARFLASEKLERKRIEGLASPEHGDAPVAPVKRRSSLTLIPLKGQPVESW